MAAILKSSHVYALINRKMGKAISEYQMIDDGDRILLGISGGKDSLSMYLMLLDRLSRAPVSYKLFPVYIDPGFDSNFRSDLSQFFKSYNQEIRIEITDHGIVGHSAKNRENPCFLCSRLRRKRLFEIADELGCKKIALGHTKDDIIETLLMNMFYAGEISSMMPAQSFFKGAFTIIRPMALVDENYIKRFIEKYQVPTFESSCPSNYTSKRYMMKNMLEQAYRTNKKIKGNIFRSMSKVNLDYLPKLSA